MLDTSVTTLFNVAVGFVMMVLVLLAPSPIGAVLQLQNVAQTAARVAAITQNEGEVQSAIADAMQADNLPTEVNGQTLFAFTDNASVQSGQTGFAAQNGPNAVVTTVTIQYNVPLYFDRALTVIGGPVLSFTLPVSVSQSYWNETQYTGS